MSQAFNVAELAAAYDNKSPQDILKLAFEHFGDELWISFSGAEDVVLVDMAWKLNKNVKVFSLDTGRLHPETYRFIEHVREHYGIAIDVLSPDPQRLEALVREKGLFSFYKDGHGECCGIRKIEPLKRKLATVKAWATGQRRHPQPGAGAGAGQRLLHARQAAVQVQPAGADEQRGGLGLYPHARTALQQPARARLHQHRLAGRAGPARQLPPAWPPDPTGSTGRHHAVRRTEDFALFGGHCPAVGAVIETR